MCESILHGISSPLWPHYLHASWVYVSNRHREKKANWDTALDRFSIAHSVVLCRLQVSPGSVSGRSGIGLVLQMITSHYKYKRLIYVANQEAIEALEKAYLSCVP